MSLADVKASITARTDVDPTDAFDATQIDDAIASAVRFYNGHRPHQVRGYGFTVAAGSGIVQELPAGWDADTWALEAVYLRDDYPDELARFPQAKVEVRPAEETGTFAEIQGIRFTSASGAGNARPGRGLEFIYNENTSCTFRFSDNRLRVRFPATDGNGNRTSAIYANANYGALVNCFNDDTASRASLREDIVASLINEVEPADKLQSFFTQNELEALRPAFQRYPSRPRLVLYNDEFASLEGEEIIIDYTRPHVLTESESTLTAAAEDGVAWYAVSILLHGLATARSTDFESGIVQSGASVATTPVAAAFSRRSAEARRYAMEIWQIKPGQTQVASASVPRRSRRQVMRSNYFGRRRR